MPTPELILRHAYGYWASAVFVAAIEHGIFDVLDGAPLTVEELVGRTGLPLRGAQALLDALIGLELVSKAGERYASSDDAAMYLVRGKQDYLGGYATMIKATWRAWESFPAAVAAGRPAHAQEAHDPGNAFWEDLVPAIAPLAFIPARAAAEHLSIASRGAFQMLDIAGGSGAFSMVWLQLNSLARASQIDWPNVNAIARKYVARFGVVDRFDTIDGDMERLPLGEAAYDYIVYASVAHGLPPDRNIAMFRKIRAALKTGGTLVITGLMANADRTGHPLLMMFNANMLLNTEHGTTYAASEYDRWLRESGFAQVAYQSLAEMPYTIVYAS